MTGRSDTGGEDVLPTATRLGLRNKHKTFEYWGVPLEEGHKPTEKKQKAFEESFPQFSPFSHLMALERSRESQPAQLLPPRFAFDVWAVEHLRIRELRHPDVE